jgi:hypothetical protein
MIIRPSSNLQQPFILQGPWPSGPPCKYYVYNVNYLKAWM